MAPGGTAQLRQGDMVTLSTAPNARPGMDSTAPRLQLRWVPRRSVHFPQDVLSAPDSHSARNHPEIDSNTLGDQGTRGSRDEHRRQLRSRGRSSESADRNAHSRHEARPQMERSAYPDVMAISHGPALLSSPIFDSTSQRGQQPQGQMDGRCSRKLRGMVTDRVRTGASWGGAGTLAPGSLLCVLCTGLLDRPVRLAPCGHLFCATCLSQALGRSLQQNRPLCCPAGCRSGPMIVCEAVPARAAVEGLLSHTSPCALQAALSGALMSGNASCSRRLTDDVPAAPLPPSTSPVPGSRHTVASSQLSSGAGGVEGKDSRTPTCPLEADLQLLDMAFAWTRSAVAPEKVSHDTARKTVNCDVPMQAHANQQQEQAPRLGSPAARVSSSSAVLDWLTLGASTALQPQHAAMAPHQETTACWGTPTPASAYTSPAPSRPSPCGSGTQALQQGPETSLQSSPSTELSWARTYAEQHMGSTHNPGPAYYSVSPGGAPRAPPTWSPTSSAYQAAHAARSAAPLSPVVSFRGVSCFAVMAQSTISVLATSFPRTSAESPTHSAHARSHELAADLGGIARAQGAVGDWPPARVHRRRSVHLSDLGSASSLLATACQLLSPRGPLLSSQGATMSSPWANVSRPGTPLLSPAATAAVSRSARPGSPHPVSPGSGSPSSTTWDAGGGCAGGQWTAPAEVGTGTGTYLGGHGGPGGGALPWHLRNLQSTLSCAQTDGQGTSSPETTAYENHHAEQGDSGGPGGSRSSITEVPRPGSVSMRRRLSWLANMPGSPSHSEGQANSAIDARQGHVWNAISPSSPSQPGQSGHVSRFSPPQSGHDGYSSSPPPPQSGHDGYSSNPPPPQSGHDGYSSNPSPPQFGQGGLSTEHCEDRGPGGAADHRDSLVQDQLHRQLRRGHRAAHSGAGSEPLVEPLQFGTRLSLNGAASDMAFQRAARRRLTKAPGSMHPLCELNDSNLPVDLVSLRASLLQDTLQSLQAAGAEAAAGLPSDSACASAPSLVRALEVTARLCWNSEVMKEAYASSGVIPSLVAILHLGTALPSAPIHAACCLALASLVYGAIDEVCLTNQWDVAKGLGVEAISLVMACHAEVDMVQLAALMALLPLARLNPMMQANICMGVLPNILAAMHRGSTAVQAKSLALLGSLVQGPFEEDLLDTVSTRLIEAGVCTAIVTSLNAHGSTCDAVLRSALFCVSMLAEREREDTAPQLKVWRILVLQQPGLPDLLQTCLLEHTQRSREAERPVDMTVMEAGLCAMKALREEQVCQQKQRQERWVQQAGMLACSCLVALAAWASYQRRA